MEDYDQADLDGDGEFDAIDLMILGESEGRDQRRITGSTGCCIPLLIVIGAIAHYLWV